MLACPSSASFVSVEGTGTSSFTSSVVAEGMMTFPSSFHLFFSLKGWEHFLYSFASFGHR